MLEAVEGRLCSLEMLEVMEVMRCILLDAVEAGNFHCGSFLLTARHHRFEHERLKLGLLLATIMLLINVQVHRSIIKHYRGAALYERLLSLHYST